MPSKYDEYRKAKLADIRADLTRELGDDHLMDKLDAYLEILFEIQEDKHTEHCKHEWREA